MSEYHRICPVCGAPLSEGDRYCQNCGAPVGPPPPPGAALARTDVPAIQHWLSSDPLLTLEIEFPERLSRWKIFVKWLLAIPHFIVLSIFGMLVSILVWIAWFIILVTGRYNQGMFELILTYMRWTANVNAYVMFQRDEYPPFGEGPYPVHLQLPLPAQLSRWKIFVKCCCSIPGPLSVTLKTHSIPFCFTSTTTLPTALSKNLTALLSRFRNTCSIGARSHQRMGRWCVTVIST